MEKIKIPEGYQQVIPYLIVKDAAGFIGFMKTVFGAEEKMRHMRDEHIIMHAELMIGDCCIMLADSTDEYPPLPGSFFIYVADADETYNKSLAAGAASVSAPADMPYGRSCGVADAYGNKWWPTTAK